MDTIFVSLTDPDTILENKQGVLTNDQHDLLRLTSGLTFWYTLGSALVIIGIVWWAVNKQMADLPANAPQIPDYYWIVLGTSIGIPLIYLGWQMVRSSRVRREIAEGVIPSEEGRIEWTGRRYRIAASVRGMRSIFGVLNELPGRYQFYLLPGSRYLLSAEPLDTPEVSREALTDILGRVFQFSNEDLASNIEGHLSPTQERRLRSQAILTGLVLVIFLSILGSDIIYAIKSGTLWSQVSSGILFLACLLIAPSTIRINKRFREGKDKIAFVQGPGTKTFRSMKPAVIKSYVVSGKQFDVSDRAYNALVEGETYRVFYTPATKKILSIETVTPNSPPPQF